MQVMTELVALGREATLEWKLGGVRVFVIKG